MSGGKGWAKRRIDYLAPQRVASASGGDDSGKCKWPWLVSQSLASQRSHSSILTLTHAPVPPPPPRHSHSPLSRHRHSHSALCLPLATATRTRHSPPMLVVHVHVHVMPEHVAAFIAATTANAQASVREPGIARFDVMQQADDPTRFVLVEVYRDAAAPAAHKETAHYATWRDTVAPMMASPRRSVKFGHVFPPDSGW